VHLKDFTAARLKATKTGVTHTLRKPIPDELLKKLEIASRKLARRVMEIGN